MRLIRELKDLPDELRRGAVSIGNFDGVHLGHAHLVKRLVTRAHEHHGPALVFTFDPHPATVLRPDEIPPSLSWMQRKIDLLGRLGVDMVVAFAADTELLELSPHEFFKRIILRHLGSRTIVEGPNFFFGHKRQGNVELLGRLCIDHGLVLDVVNPIVVEGGIVSSSRIRKLVAQGEIDRVNRLLTEPYRIRGRVVHGEGRGVKLGFPTVNLEHIDTLLPGQGVYAGHACLGARIWPAAVSIGPNCTFDEDSLKVEAHLIGADEDFYDAEVEIEFMKRLRGPKKFASVELLVEQIDCDIRAVGKIVGQKAEAGG
ncbi:MAG: bifunctional riboflavin kinase/FAD synthetase [Planctomycetota bacterium]|nr:bifunctional riboflavin kinase/FAD synthetase [Planctomycetota bacterium]